MRKWFPGTTLLPIRKGEFFFTPFTCSAPPVRSGSRLCRYQENRAFGRRRSAGRRL